MSKLQKTCIICKKEKTIVTDLYKSTRNLSGFENRCKECSAKQSSIRHKLNYDPVKEREKSVARRLSGRTTLHELRMREKYPEKYRARTTFRNAVASGKLKKLPCEVCGEAKTEGHHDDYSKPLEVRWLCLKHHKEHHRKYKLINLSTEGELT